MKPGALSLLGVRGRWRRVGAVAVVGALAGAVCVGVVGSSAATVSGWARRDLMPVTQPMAVAGRFVVVVASGGGLRVVGLDARTGSTVWSQPASASRVAPGQAPALALVNGEVIFIGQDAGTYGELVAADPATGREIWKSRPGAFTTWPYPCTGDLSNVCATGLLPLLSQQTTLLRFDGHSGALLPGPVISGSGLGRTIGEGLFDPGRRDPEVMVAASGSSVSWTKRLASVFTTPGASTDWGWNIDRVTRVGLFVGGVGAAPIVQTQTRLVKDLSHNMTAGFRISDGAPVWRLAGATYACNELPCPGSVQDGYVTQAAETAGGPTTGVALSETGTASGPPTGTQPTISSNAQATLEGFDPANGRVIWRLSARHDVALISAAGLPPQVAANTIVLPLADGRLITLNLANGSQHATSTRAPAWCRKPILYTQRIPYTPGDGHSYTNYIGQFALYPCTSAQQTLTTPNPVPAFVGTIGAQQDGLTAWSENTGIIAAHS